LKQYTQSEFIERIDEALIDLGLQDWKVYHFTTVGSTNTIARNLLTHQDQVIVLADEQTSGRGTKGKSWESPIGGCWLTLGINLEIPFVELASIIAERLTILLSDLIDFDCIHKPPNDIYLQGKKLAGILVETQVQDEKIVQIIVGIGINVANNIPDTIRDIAINFHEVKIHRRVSTVALEVALEVIFLLRGLIRKSKHTQG
jgi:biotin-[acetyl-CoA-carboxylase] ligase BirA-like protein